MMMMQAEMVGFGTAVAAEAAEAAAAVVAAAVVVVAVVVQSLPEVARI